MNKIDNDNNYKTYKNNNTNEHLILKKIIQLIIMTITFGLTEMKIFGDWLITSFL